MHAAAAAAEAAACHAPCIPVLKRRTQETFALLNKYLDLTKVFTGFPLIYWIVNFIGMHVPRFEKNKSFHTVHMEELNLVY
jgi:hypothetical protein